MHVVSIFIIKFVILKKSLWKSNYYYFSALSNIIHIRTEHPTMHLKNDLAIVCYITNPGDIASVHILELQMNKTGSFQSIVFMYSNVKDIWKDTVLQNISKVSGSLHPPSSAELKLVIDKKSIQCPNEFAMFRCRMKGLDLVTHKVEEQFTKPISVSYCGKYNYVFSI